MLGGGGGGFTELFAAYETFYPLLRSAIAEQPCVSGLDLDIEEPATLSDVRRLIHELRRDLGADFTITTSPTAYALTDGARDFYSALHADGLVEWMNVQCYESFDASTFASIISSGYPPSAIVLTMLGDSYDSDSFVRSALPELRRTLAAYPGLRGAALWEYGDTRVDPVTWFERIARL